MECPLCKASLDETKIVLNNRNYKTENKIQLLTAKCIYEQFGCKKIVRIKDLTIHENQCDYAKLAKLINREKKLSSELDMVRIQIENILLVDPSINDYLNKQLEDS